MKIKIIELENLVLQALSQKFSRKNAHLIKDVVMFAEITGRKSHGIQRLVDGNYSVLYQNPKADFELIKKTANSLLIKGNNNPGILVSAVAAEESIKLATNSSFGAVGTFETQSTSGCLSYYLQHIAENNFIAIVMSRSTYTLAPFNSKEALFGSNPIGFGFPSKDKPLIFDMSSSKITWGELTNAYDNKRKIPKDSAIDKSGKATDDPSEVLLNDGALLPFDNSYKGSGLAMCVEILAGIFVNAGFLDVDNDTKGWGNLFLTINPALFTSIETFKENINVFRERLLNSPTRDGQSLRLPGMQTLKEYDTAVSRGWIEVEEKNVKLLQDFKTTGEIKSRNF